MVFLADVSRGAWRVLAVGARGPAGDTYVPYIELRRALARHHASECALLERLIAYTQSFGPPFQTGKAKRLADSSLYEMRTRRGTRLFWIYGPQRSVILLNGFQKKGWDIPARKLKRAEAWTRALADPRRAALMASAVPCARIAA